MPALFRFPAVSRLVAPLCALALAGALGHAHAAGPTGLLNDTGLTQCDNGSNVLATCATANTGDASAMPRQDARFGRDVATPTKTGGGAAGFDFSKICMDGSSCASATTGDTSANSASSSAWACTKDNVTNLVWSLQTGQGDWTTYAQSTLPTATNAVSRCGFSSGWRLPTRRELLSLVHNGLTDYAQPRIDVNYFPATQAYVYWTSDTYAPDPSVAWIVDFDDGNSGAYDKTDSFYVRLVRSGQ